MIVYDPGFRTVHKHLDREIPDKPDQRLLQSTRSMGSSLTLATRFDATLAVSELVMPEGLVRSARQANLP